MSEPDDQDASILIRGGTVVAFDGHRHRRLEDGAVAVAGDRILHVGTEWRGKAGRVIDADGMIVIPGQISTHAHVGAHEGPRLLVDGGRRDLIRSGFLHFTPASRSGAPGFYAPQDARAALRYGFATLVRHGVTTVLAYGGAGPDGGETVLAAADEMGIRLYWSPIVSGGRYWAGHDGTVVRELDDDAGLRGLEAVFAFEAKRPPGDGRLRGAVVLDEFHVSTPELRREAKSVARALGLPFTLHFIEQHREFFDTMTATGRTPIQLLADEGVLDAGTILAHCIYHAGHSLVRYPVVDDVGLLGATGACLAHSPLAFSRRGVALESFDRFRKAGVTVALGTDTYPMDMFSEMRTASIMGKVADGHPEAARAEDVFAASNLGGAAALGRPDLGRIAPGAKADIVLVDTRSLAFGPNPDPLRALVHLATPEMVDTVIVDGEILVDRKRLVRADEHDLLAAARRSSETVWRAFPRGDPAGRGILDVFPPSLPDWAEPPSP